MASRRYPPAAMALAAPILYVGHAGVTELLAGRPLHALFFALISGPLCIMTVLDLMELRRLRRKVSTVEQEIARLERDGVLDRWYLAEAEDRLKRRPVIWNAPVLTGALALAAASLHYHLLGSGIPAFLLVAAVGFALLVVVR